MRASISARVKPSVQCAPRTLRRRDTVAVFGLDGIDADRHRRPLLWLFVVPELAWGVVQWLPLAGAHADGSGSSTARAALTSAAPMRSSRGG